MPDTLKHELIAFVEIIPAFPKSVQRTVQLSSDVSASANKGNPHYCKCPVMTFKMLKVINSAFYGLRQKITSIQRTVIHIGLSSIKNLALNVAALGTLVPNNKEDFANPDCLSHPLTTVSISRKWTASLSFIIA
ncbi:MAG TPA: HDOD domain-containing protein [Methylococcaceae bacterium]|nr:HDOD domain-containing protein [Methylococcaceae bacterium]